MLQGDTKLPIIQSLFHFVNIWHSGHHGMHNLPKASIPRFLLCSLFTAGAVVSSLYTQDELPFGSLNILRFFLWHSSDTCTILLADRVTHGWINAFSLNLSIIICTEYFIAGCLFWSFLYRINFKAYFSQIMVIWVKIKYLKDKRNNYYGIY